MPSPRVSRPDPLRLSTDDVSDPRSVPLQREKPRLVPRGARVAAASARDGVPSDVRKAMDYLLRRIAADSKRK